MADNGRNLLEWAPPTIALGMSARNLAQSGKLSQLRQVWERGWRAGMAMENFIQELHRQSMATGLPAHLTPQQEAFILEVIRHATGTRERLAHVKSLRELEDLRHSLPEVYQKARQLSLELSRLDPVQLIRGEALEQLVPATESLISFEALGPSQLYEFLREVEANRRAGKLVQPFAELHQAFSEAFYGQDVRVSAIWRQMVSREERQLIGLRLAAGRTAVDIPLMTPQREFISRTGAVFMPAFIETGTKEIAPDVYVMQQLTEALKKPLPANVQSYLNETIRHASRRSVYEVQEAMQDVSSPIAKLWLRARAVVEGETPQEISQRREAVARSAWAAGRHDRTSWLPASASEKGLVGRRSFMAHEWSLSGRLVDEKAYKTFAKSMPLARESVEFLEKDLGHGRLPWLFSAPAAPKGYFEAARETGERVMTMRYGMIHEEHLTALEEMFRLDHKRKFERRLFLRMTEDEMLMAAEMKDIWKAERALSYTLDESYGISAALKPGTKLQPGMFMGISPLGHPVYAGRRGGEEVLESLERVEGKVIARVRNIVEMQPGTKVFGTGGLKHTVRQAMRLQDLQELYRTYLTQFQGVPEAEAATIARQITGLTIHKGFKSPEQQVDQLLSSLAAYQQEMAGTPAGEEAARLLRKFGFEPSERPDIAAWKRVRYDMTPEEILQNFMAAKQFEPEGVLTKAAQRSEFLRAEFIRMGPALQDVGAGRRATFSLEMANVLFDKGHENLAMHLLSRTDPESHQTLRGLAQMLEPFAAVTPKYGTHIEELTAAELMAGEKGVADWLAHRGSSFPKRGIIHFAPYELPSGQRVSYIQLPTESLASLKGIYLEDGRTAASTLQRSLYRALTSIKEDILHQPETPAYRAAAEALQEYYDTLAKLMLGKEGAVRQVTGGRVKHSMQLQAASLFSGLPKDPSAVYITNQAMEEMLQGLAKPQARELLQTIDPQGRYSSLLEAFRKGEAFPGLIARYPAENPYAIMPVRLRSAEWARQQVQKMDPTFGRFTLGARQAYIDPELFKLMVGDFDADVVHTFLATNRSAASEIQSFLANQGIEKYIQDWEAGMGSGLKQKGKLEFTNTLPRVLARLKQQEAGKTDVGIISNAINRLREAARMAAVPEAADWTALIAESLTIKAKHHSLDRFVEIYRPEEILAHLEGSGLGMTIPKRVNYLIQAFREMDPTIPIGDYSPVGADFKPIMREGRPLTYRGLESKLATALEAYDQTYKRSAWDRMTRLLKRPASKVTGKDALRLVREAKRLDNDQLAAMLIGSALDKGGWRSRVRHLLSGVTAVAREGGGLLHKYGKWLGAGALAGAGIALLRAPKPLTPESITGDEQREQGLIRELEPSSIIPPPTARISPPQPALSVRVKARTYKNLPYRELARVIHQVSGAETQISVDDYSRRFDREDLRRFRKR